MSVEISNQDWDLLDKFTPGGISEEDVATSIKAYRDEGRSDEEIQQALNNKVAEAKSALAKVAETNKQFAQDPKRMAAEKFLKIDKYVEPVLGRLAATGYEFGNVASLGVGEALTGLTDKALGTDLRSTVKELRKEYPITSGIGRFGGFFTGGPKAAVEAAGKTVQKALGPATTKAGAFGRSVASSVAAGLGGQGAAELERAAEAVANTREIESAKESLDRIIPETLWNVGLSAALGAASTPIMNVVSPTKKAVNLIGEENIRRGQAAVSEALASGTEAKDAPQIFLAEATKNMDAESAYYINKMIQKNPVFAQFVREQMVGAQQVNLSAAKNATASQLQKYSHEMLQSLYGTNYRNELGATDFDTSANGLKRLLGTHDAGPVFEARAEALTRAEQRVQSNAMEAQDVRNIFDELSGNLRRQGNKDYKRAVEKIEQNTIQSFADSEERTEALNLVNEQLAKMNENGVKPTPTQVTNLTNDMLQLGAQKHFEKIMAEGTNSVTDINDIKNFFTAIDEQAVAAGGAEAFGAFNEGVNARILNPLDSVLAEANNAYKYQKALLKSHGLGNSFDPVAPNVSEIDNNISNVTDVRIAGAKLAAFKMGFMNKLTDLAVSGDRKAFNDMAASMLNKKTIGKYFNNEEVEQIMAQVRPHAEAAYNIENMLNVANGGAQPDATLVQGIKTVTSAGVGARGAFIGNLTTLLNSFKYGKGTAQKIMELSQNPTWNNFNNLVKTTKDLTEKQTIARSITQALRAVVEAPGAQKVWGAINAVDSPKGE